jgi:hypothetical protein
MRRAWRDGRSGGWGRAWPAIVVAQDIESTEPDLATANAQIRPQLLCEAGETQRRTGYYLINM